MLAVLHDNFILAKLVLVLLELRKGILVFFVRKQIGDDMRVTLCSKVTLAYQEA